MVFVCIWVLKIRCPHRYYTLTTLVWGPIFNYGRMVQKNKHHTSMGFHTVIVMPIHIWLFLN